LHGAISIHSDESNQKQPKTFLWWALCSAAACHGSHNVQARSNLSAHYGISFTQNSLQQKLSPFNGYLMKACETKLSLLGYFGISFWDNSQLVTPIKFQCGGRLLVSIKVTSRIFVKPYKPSYGTTQPAALQTKSSDLPQPVDITYLDQPIPSPVGMASFERNDGSYLQIQHIEDYDSAMDVDITGFCVKAYIKLVLKSFWMNVSPKSNSYQFRVKDCIWKNRQLFLRMILFWWLITCNRIDHHVMDSTIVQPASNDAALVNGGRTHHGRRCLAR
jgi:hypothetical protein